MGCDLLRGDTGDKAKETLSTKRLSEPPRTNVQKSLAQNAENESRQSWIKINQALLGMTVEQS